MVKIARLKKTVAKQAGQNEQGGFFLDFLSKQVEHLRAGWKKI